MNHEEILVRLAEMAADEPVAVLWLYGSRAKGTAAQGSDYDLAVAVVRDGQVMFVRDQLRLIREELRITSMWEVDYQYHRIHYG
ncbi:MAG: nucleotidyltransferase domain-containing protein [Marinospirillum sp.]|nr:nucleotidyltransferase domain-containing protein [Marinospirillum sp.]